jgi:hypothetical protein
MTGICAEDSPEHLSKDPVGAENSSDPVTCSFARAAVIV